MMLPNKLLRNMNMCCLTTWDLTEKVAFRSASQNHKIVKFTYFPFAFISFQVILLSIYFVSKYRVKTVKIINLLIKT